MSLVTGCDRYRSASNESEITWDSARIHDLRAEWQALHAAYAKNISGNDGKTEYGTLQRMVEQLLRERISDAEARRLAATCEVLPLRPRADRFFDDVLAFLVKSLTEQGERGRLVNLLGVRCPIWIDEPGTIEYYLACHDDRLADSVAILGDAYWRCQVLETRAVLALAMRRGFDGFGIGGKDDAEFVRNAMAWYFEHKANLSVNSNYGGNEISPIQAPLFVGKAEPERLPGPNDHFWQAWRTYDPLEKRRPASGALANLEGTWEVVEIEAGPDPDLAAAGFPESEMPSFRNVSKGSQFVVRGNIVEWFGSDEIKIDQFRMAGPFNFPIGADLKPCLITLDEMPRSAQKRVKDWLRTDFPTPRHSTSALFELAPGALRLRLAPRGSPQGPLALDIETVLSLRRIPETSISNSQRASARQQAGISWVAPALDDIREKWQSLQNAEFSAPRPATSDALRNAQSHRRQAVDRLFRRSFSTRDVVALAETCDTLPAFVNERAFEEAVLGFLAESLAEANDRKRLVQMLSQRCPNWIPKIEPIEWRLATGGRRLDEPILVLFEAYSRCELPGTRSTLAVAIRRAFANLVIAGQDDAEYIRNAMRWYEARKNDLRVNGDYLRNESGVLKAPLFTEEAIMPYGVQRNLSTRFQRWSESHTPTTNTAIGILAIGIIWSLHSAIAAGLSAPIVARSRGRVDWRFWHALSALIIPFGVWSLLLLIHPLGIAKGLGNLAEPFVFALATPCAAILRIRFSRRLFWQAHAGLLFAVLLSLLASAAFAVYFMVPALVV